MNFSNYKLHKGGSMPVPIPEQRSRITRVILALGAALLLAAGCTYSDNPDVNAAVKRSQCNTTVFGGVLEYLMVQALCEADRPNEPLAETEEDRWKDLCLDAKSGDGRARSALAWYYRKGWPPVDPDIIEAYKWFALSADAGFTDAPYYRDELGAELTPDQLTEAKVRVAAWAPTSETCTVAQGGMTR